MPEDPAAGFAGRLVAAIDAAGLNRNRVAVAIGVDGSQVGRWCAGKGEPRLGQLVRLARLLGASLDDLVAGGGGAPVDRLDADDRLILQAFREGVQDHGLTVTRAIGRLTAPQVAYPPRSEG